MKKKSDARSAFLIPRVVLGFALCSAGMLLVLAAFGKPVPATPAARGAANAIPLINQLPGEAQTWIQLTPTGDPSWVPTGSLNIGRYLHTMTLLPNGEVLVAGGVDDTFTPSVSAELYDPATGTWTATGSMRTRRASHTATLLTNGQVLVAGGPMVSALGALRSCMIRRVKAGLRPIA